MNKLLATFALAIVTAAPLAAQKKPAAAPPLQLSINSVQDRRTSTGSFSSLNIEVNLGSLLAKEVFAARVNLTKAVDDTGADLLDPERGEARFENTPGSTPYVRDDQIATVGLELKNPGRDATAVKELRGEVELYIPSRDKDAVALIPKFGASAGKPLANKALKASGVEITLVTPAQLEAEKKKAMDAKRKEVATEGVDEETINYYVSMVADSFLSPGEGEIVARVKDPNKRIHEIGFVNAEGEAARFYVDERDDGFTVLSTFSEPLPVGATLRVVLRTPKSIQKVPIALTDVTLP